MRYTLEIRRGRERAAPSRTTKIEWTERAYAFWLGCTEVSDGCNLCYAEEWTVHRFHKAGPDQPSNSSSLG